jgi:hypothetical protein
MAFVQFMASKTGRWLRVAVGIILLVLGIMVVEDTAGIVLTIIALVPLLAGIFDVCVIAPLFGAPFKGADIRARKS